MEKYDKENVKRCLDKMEDAHDKLTEVLYPFNVEGDPTEKQEEIENMIQELWDKLDDTKNKLFEYSEENK